MYGARYIGKVYTKSGKLVTTKNIHWYEHYVVRKGAMVYDRITGPAGMHIDEYKKLFEYGNYLTFGNIVKI